MALRDSAQGTECQYFLSFEICWSHMSDDRSSRSGNAGYDLFRPSRFTPAAESRTEAGHEEARWAAASCA
ncbi:hypothetical protein, partial [Streptomyces diastaticus]